MVPRNSANITRTRVDTILLLDQDTTLLLYQHHTNELSINATLSFAKWSPQQQYVVS